MPLSTDQNVQAREFVLNSLLTGSVFFVSFAFLIILLVSWLVLHHAYVVTYFPALFGSLFFFLTLYAMARKGKYRPAATLLIIGYSVPAVLLVRQWGILVPESILLFALVIVLSGILLGSKYAFINSLLVTVVLTVFLVLQFDHVVVPDISWGKQYGTVADVLGFAVTFTVIGLVSWLYNWQMERSLTRARRSERALQRQKGLLEVTVERRTRQLQAAQAEKMKQLYHFAELGHVSTALLHDLSNHLAMLTLDIESLGSSHSNRPGVVKQAQKSITYVEELVQRVSYQLQGEAIVRDFSIVEEVSESMQLLAYKAKRAQVALELIVNPKQGTYQYSGDFVGFRQLVSNILANGIDAYSDTTRAPKQVRIEVTRTAADYIITITDRGKGIKASDLGRIFNPFFSTREEGMGIGLFIARQLTEEQFKGHLTVTSKPNVGTTFTIQLPRKRK
ncbi:MAG TPA: HAMP domain-containing sensor histidine kinase [Verrucomicrobiae bacterium]|nr:HAMP domain-containing sensor histidine kinase [Verrucomicrobiae bacterium]